jgi:hypothetical protein
MSSSRREFIRNGLLGSFLVTIYNPFQQLFADSKPNRDLPSWKELIEYARWCPTVHNLQPHRIKIISDTEAQLYYEPGRLLPVGDPNSVFATVAMGIFIEHLSIVAGYNGYKVVVKEIFDPLKTTTAGLTKFADLRLVPTEKKEDLDRELIKKRRTSRLHYSGNPLSEKTLNTIKEEAARSGHEIFWSSEKKMVDYVIRLNQQTLFEDLESKANRDELARLFRYTDEEAETKKDGLWARCMCFPGKLLKSVFIHHEKWEHGLRKKLLSNHYKKSFKGTQTICWVCGKFENTADWLNAGKTLARSWLLLTRDGACIHPFGSLITNKEAYKKINEAFTRPRSDEKTWMIFRAGYSKEPARSYRISAEEIIIN